MTLASGEVYSGGQVRDSDGRMVVAPDAVAGRSLLFAAITTASSGQSAVVAADATRKIKVVSYVIVATTAVTVKFQNASTDLTGAMPLGANGGVAATGSTAAWLFETSVNQAFNINLGGNVQVSGHVAYFLEA